MSDSSVLATMIDFVREIGLDVRRTELKESFLPGLDIGHGAVLLDESRLLCPGDILHEAGHLAVTEPAMRNAPKLEPTDGEEMAAIAWSFAAARHLDIDPRIVLHDQGYQGGGTSIYENFAEGRYFGVPLLDWFGMTVDPMQAKPGGPEPYPHMLRWLRPEPTA